ELLRLPRAPRARPAGDQDRPHREPLSLLLARHERNGRRRRRGDPRYLRGDPGRAAERRLEGDRHRLPQPTRTRLADAHRPRRDRVAGRSQRVKVEGSKEFDAPAQLVWDVLNDPEKMAKLLPGVESFEIQDDRRWKASVKVPLGMGGLKLNFQFEKVEERPIEYAKLASKGQGVGAIVAMETEFNLTPNGDTTSMAWSAYVRIAGPIGSMGQRVFQPIVNQQVGNVLNALEAQVEEAKGGGGS